MSHQTHQIEPAGEQEGRIYEGCKICGAIAEELLERPCEGPVPQLEVRDHGDVIELQWSFPEGGVKSSTFPQMLVTADHALDGRVIGISLVGPRARELREAFSLKLSEDEIKDLKGAVRSGVKWVDVYKGGAYLDSNAARASRWLRTHAGIKTKLDDRTGQVTFE